MSKFCDSITPCFGSGMDTCATVFVPPNQWVYLLCFAEVDILAAHSTCIDLALCCHENFRGHFIHEFVQLAV